MDATVVSFIIAWFAQMGVHEGAHAYAAHACGDDTAYLLGKKTFDPFRHVQWNDFSSVLWSVIFPIVTAMEGRIPMGMAWVPVNPLRFKKMRRDHALVAAAGPAGNFVLAFFLLGLHFLFARLDPFAQGSASVVLNVLDSLCRAVYLTSIVYGLFNLVPIPPLDGSRVLYYFLPQAGRNMMDSLQPYGFLILIAVFWVGQGSALLTPFIFFFMTLWGLSG